MTAFALVVLFFATLLFERQLKAFLFNMDYGTPIDLVFQVELMLPFALFAVSNWSITTLTDGKGTMKDIINVICYPLAVPILFKVLITLLSRYLSISENVYIAILGFICWGLYGILVFIGLSVIHQYSFLKTIGTLILTVFASAVIVFIIMLFYSLLQEIVGFVYSIYREMSLRL